MRPTCIILYGLTLSALAVWRPNLHPPTYLQVYEFVARQKLKDIVMKKQEVVENVVKPLKEEGWNIFYFVRLQRVCLSVSLSLLFLSID